MFLNLIKLYNKYYSSGKMPLEDYNTECFYGILNMFDDIKNDFIANFLKLPDDNYTVKTQVKRDLPNSSNCIIDVVFFGDRNVCFIENKVESSEGWEQLNRYKEVLKIHFENKKHFLFYCAKYSEEKDENNYFDCNFKQFKWYEVARFLKQYSKTNKIIENYIKFLNEYGIEQENVFKTENLVTMENMNKTIDIIQFHIQNSIKDFINIFTLKVTYNKNYDWDQIRLHNRISYKIGGILKGSNYNDSEILYSIKFEDLKLRTQIFVNYNHSKYNQIETLNFNKEIFTLDKYDFGINIGIEQSIGDLLNDETSHIKVKEWFKNSFLEVKKLILENRQVDWHEDLV